MPAAIYPSFVFTVALLVNLAQLVLLVWGTIQLSKAD